MIVLFLVVLTLIFPIFINGYFILSLNEKKLFFSIKVFSLITLLGGYFELNNYLLMHYSNKKARIIKISSLFPLKKSFNVLKDYHILNFNSLTETTSQNLTTVNIAHIASFINWYLCDLAIKKKSYLRLRNEINLTKTNNTYMFIKASIVINVFTILIKILKKITEKILNENN